MLTIRNTQIHALAEHDVRAFRGMVVGLLGRKYPEALADAPVEYTGQLVDVAIATCADAGFDQQGTTIEFAESLLKNDMHPMTAGQVNAKAQTILREFHTRALFLRLQSLGASTAAPAADEADESTVDPTQE